MLRGTALVNILASQPVARPTRHTDTLKRAEYVNTIGMHITTAETQHTFINIVALESVTGKPSITDARYGTGGRGDVACLFAAWNKSHFQSHQQVHRVQTISHRNVEWMH
jgi:hypothetical protein